jgi:hypothetical protein
LCNVRGFGWVVYLSHISYYNTIYNNVCKVGGIIYLATLPFQDLVLTFLFDQVILYFLIQMSHTVLGLVLTVPMRSPVCHSILKVITLVSMTMPLPSYLMNKSF